MSDSSNSLRVVFAAGGTGGHVFPALAIYEELVRRRPDTVVMFVGTAHGIEARLVAKISAHFETIWIAGFVRGRILKNLTLPFKIIASFWKCHSLLQTFRPHVVIGTGGYVTGPVMLTAQLMKLPTVIQEQNSLPGVTTKQLSKRASAVCVAFTDAVQRLNSKRVHVTGNPVRTAFGIQQTGKQNEWNLDPGRKTILAFGGSLGARSINHAIAECLADLTHNYNLIWQTGRAGLPKQVDQSALEVARQSGRLVVLEFIENMSAAYAQAALAVCRAGAMTLSELFMMGLPAILVPFPHAAEDHQTKNAESVVNAGAARLIADRDLTGPRLLHAIRQLFAIESDLHSMSEAMRTLARPRATADIVDIILANARPA